MDTLPRVSQLVCVLLLSVKSTHFVLLKINAQVKCVILLLVIEIQAEVLKILLSYDNYYFVASLLPFSSHL